MTGDAYDLKYIAHLSQVAGVKRYKMVDGASKDLEMIEVNNGSGLVFTIVPDKCLDIFNLIFKGKPVSFISSVGLVPPFYYDSHGYGWLKTFGGGLFVTCGLTNVGEPCIFEGNEYGLHGSISQTRADGVKVNEHWNDNDLVFEISGKIRQVKSLVENLVIERKICISLFKNEIRVTDTIKNEGQTRRPFMILYHMNFGYPLVNPNSEFIVPIRSTEGFNDYCEARKEHCLEIPEPNNQYVEETYIHKVYSKSHQSGFCIIDDKNNPTYGVSVRYSSDELHNLGQNNFFREKEYFIAFEPCNNDIKGAAFENEKGTLQYLEPAETIHIELIITLDTDVENLKSEIQSFNHK